MKSEAIPTTRETLIYLMRLIVVLRPHWRGFAKGIVLGIPLALLGMAMPYLSMLLIDNVYPSRDLRLLDALVLAIAVLSLTVSALGSLRGYYTQVIATHIGAIVNLMYFAHVQRLPMSFFDVRQVGEIVSRSNDLRSAVNSTSTMVETLVTSVIYLAFVPPFLFMMNWKLAILALLSLPVATLISTASARFQRQYMKKSAEKGAELSSFQIESVRNIQTLKILCVERFAAERARLLSQEQVRSQLVAASFATATSISNAFVRVLGTGVFTWFAWRAILDGSLTLGGFIAFSAYLGYLTGPLSKLAGLFPGFQQVAVSLGRAFEYLDYSAEADGHQYSIPSIPFTQQPGEIVIDSVTFGYTPERPVLKEISLNFPPGASVAVVGPSGAGKSTLIRLITRMSEPHAGRVLFDGIPLPRMSYTELRQQVVAVTQDVSLFHGSVWDNLTYGLKDVGRSEVENAVRICRMDQFIRELPDGFETPVAEWGSNLSGGQRQRLAIARALIRRPRVLVLDEATSQIDAETENQIVHDLLEMRAEFTLITITHRITTAKALKMIYVLDAGKIVGGGTDPELLQTCECYRQLVAAGDPLPQRRVLHQLGRI